MIEGGDCITWLDVWIKLEIQRMKCLVLSQYEMWAKMPIGCRRIPWFSIGL